MVNSLVKLNIFEYVFLEPNLRRKIRVSFINAVGLDEAGVDGGGLFREFMNELLKSSFNPIRGLFKLTSDGYLYPNPNVAFIDENFGPHYYFLGRMLGKVGERERGEGEYLKFCFRRCMKNFLRNYHLQLSSYKKFFHGHQEKLIYII
jgi:hypothetical protein